MTDNIKVIEEALRNIKSNASLVKDRQKPAGDEIPRFIAVDSWCDDIEKALAELRDALNTEIKEEIRCKVGHEFTKKNTYLHPNGSRVCMACARESRKKYYNKTKGTNQ